MTPLHLSRPPILVGDTDQDRLAAMTAGAAGEALLTELARAEVVPEARLPADVVRMGSWVRYSTKSGGVREVTLVWPEEADIGRGRISVLTPIGTGLLGLRAGQSIAWLTRDGRQDVLRVEEVRAPGG
ncbi:MAG: nucleoside diphosphate kinase regulator [Proteobacteria bacterium]|nr:nucleoside diphosphate kinase regulator [Pseudomonadota bacterium]MBS0574239.1 nucleoside diphosphate kinase regulator [Pseudomonadota bacterium]